MITSEYMSEEEAEKYQGKMHFVVHSPDFISTDKCFLPFYMPIVIVHHTVLNQLISKLDRRLQKSSAASMWLLKGSVDHPWMAAYLRHLSGGQSWKISIIRASTCPISDSPQGNGGGG